ncbi:MAG: hypothetical protein IIC08_01845 [Proteobacteria bacterium]|nr:hypothetical protein [Pseudomonadota bacterium]
MIDEVLDHDHQAGGLFGGVVYPLDGLRWNGEVGVYGGVNRRFGHAEMGRSIAVGIPGLRRNRSA